MKIGVISDIHSNIVALEAVLKALSEENIDKYIIAGDHICDGPAPLEVINKIKALDAWYIKGNRENYILDMHNSDLENWKKYKQVSAIVWTYEELDERALDWIGNLKEKMFIEVGKEKIKIVHGSPHDVYEHLYPHDDEKLDLYTNNLDASVLVCGHTHHAFIKLVNDRLIINPGSVGLSFIKPFTAEYGILSFENGEWSGELKTVSYDGNTLKKNFIDKNTFNEVGLWAELIYKSLKDARNYNSEFVKEAIERDSEKGSFISNEAWSEVEKEYLNNA